MNRATERQSRRGTQISPSSRKETKEELKKEKHSARSLQVLEREATRLNRLANQGRQDDPAEKDLWGEIKMIANDLMQGSKAVLDELGLKPKDLVSLLGFL
jgi:cobalamin-dependent methionine synthase I